MKFIILFIFFIGVLFPKSYGQNYFFEPFTKPAAGIVELVVHGEGQECQLQSNERDIGRGIWKENVWKLRWDTTAWEDGKYTLLAKIKNNNQWITTPSILIIVDNSSPQIAIHPFIQKKRNEVLLIAEVKDILTAVCNVKFIVDQKWTGNGIPCLDEKNQILPNLFQYSWNVPDDATGYHILEVQASDDAGNIAKASDKIRLDRQGPRIQVLAPLAQGPSNGPLVCETRITDASGIQNVDFILKQNPQLRGTSWQDGDVWGIKWHDISDGEYQITVIAYDKLSNSNSIDIFTQSDQTLPNIIWNKPSPDFISNSPIPITVEIKDASPILGANLVVSNQPSFPLKQDGKFWNCFFQPNQDGVFSLVVEAKDSAGNIGKSEAIIVTYDSTPPEGTLFYPKQDFYTNGIILEVHAEDDISGVAGVEFQLDDKIIPNTSTKPGSWQTKIVVEKSGRYNLISSLQDKAGNITKLPALELAIDTMAPTITVPNDIPKIFSKQANIPIHIQDDLSGIKEVSAFLYDKPIVTIENFNDSSELTWDADNWEEGWYPIVLQAIDKAGNRCDGATLTIAIDRSFPKVIAEITPHQLQIGVVHAKLIWEDKPAGIDTNKIPKIFAILGSNRYEMELSNFSSNFAEAKMLITSSHPEGIATIHIEGLQDRVGHVLSDTTLGKVTVQSAGGFWPLVPNDQAHPLLAAWDQDRPQEKSGLWIAAKPGAEVKAIEDGQIVEMSTSIYNRPGYLRIQRLRDSFTWGYHHIVVGKNILANRTWLPGDIIRAGEVIATIPEVPSSNYSYLYLELVEWKEKKWESVTSPIPFLHPKPSFVRASPSVLEVERHHESASPRHLQFFIPKRYQEFPVARFSWSDLFIILYVFLIVGICFSIGMFEQTRSKDKLLKWRNLYNYLRKKINLKKIWWWKN